MKASDFEAFSGLWPDVSQIEAFSSLTLRRESGKLGESLGVWEERKTNANKR